MQPPWIELSYSIPKEWVPLMNGLICADTVPRPHAREILGRQQSLPAQQYRIQEDDDKQKEDDIRRKTPEKISRRKLLASHSNSDKADTCHYEYKTWYGCNPLDRLSQDQERKDHNHDIAYANQRVSGAERSFL